ncbi:MAG: CHAT domain-containing protein [Bacteroidales bacterium]|nr:CHAT domain-containing protein [Bacteroidales bacterium]
MQNAERIANEELDVNDNWQLNAKLAMLLRIGENYIRLAAPHDAARILDVLIRYRDHLDAESLKRSHVLALYLTPVFYGVDNTRCMNYGMFASEEESLDSDLSMFNYGILIHALCIDKNDKAFDLFNKVSYYLKELQTNTIRGNSPYEYSDVMRQCACMIFNLITSDLSESFPGQYCYELCFNNLVFLRQFTFSQTNNLTNDIKHTLDINYKKSIAKVMNDDEVVVEITNRNIFSGGQVETLGYAAYVLDNSGTIDLVELCIDDDIHQLLDKTSDEPWTLYTTHRDKLESLVMKSLEPYFNGKRKIYLTPSGVLNSINFSLLDKRIVELTSSYELCRKYRPSTNHSMLLVGDVDYDKVIVDTLRGDNERSSWGNIEHTKIEIDAIEKNISPILDVKKLSGTNADERVVRTECNKSPVFAHFATHAFLYKKEDVESEAFPLNGFLNPQAMKPELNYSGLVLNGANRTQNNLQKVSTLADGLFFADEISQLNMQGTQLVCLSACQSGLGVFDDYEGCLGLVRAFKLAGVRSVVASLWNVNDNAAALFMIDFYKRMLHNSSMHTSFIETVDHIKTLFPNEPKHWAAFKLVDCIEDK